MTDHCGDEARRCVIDIVKVRSVSLMNGLRASSGGHRHMAWSVTSIRNPVLLAVPLLKLTSDIGMHSDVRNGRSGRKLVIVPSGIISALKAKDPGHCLSLESDEPVRPPNPENVPSVCARTLSEPSQCEDEDASGP